MTASELSLQITATSKPIVSQSPPISRMLETLSAALRSLANSTITAKQLLTSFLMRACCFRDVTKTLSTSTSTTSLPSAAAAILLTTLCQLSDEVAALLSYGSRQDVLLKLSSGLQRQFKDALKDNPECMLPSYNHQLPNGNETGRYLALDVGGSTFRVALVDLSIYNGKSRTKIVAQRTYRIMDEVKKLEGVLFFDWMAFKIENTISSVLSDQDRSGLTMGLAWSFPIEQTSLRSGLLQTMGKGFLAAYGLLGQDLGDVLEAACQRRGLQLTISAIVNDSTATLLANAYSSPSTRLGLILGTGVNVAVHLPTTSLSSLKFGSRPSAWHDAARNVLVNTELGMFGKGLLPLTRWDEELNKNHERPGFQPYEHLVSGRYLGEVVRLIMNEGVRDAGLFGGTLPKSFESQYSLGTEVLSSMEASTTIDQARRAWETCYPNSAPLLDEEVVFIRDVARHVSRRASGLIATSLHALWQLRIEANATSLEDVHTVGCNGSVIQSYAGFKENCQAYLNDLVEATGGKRGTIALEMAEESSLIGAAVAVACL